MPARSPRIPCFLPPTPPRPRGGAPRLLTLATTPNRHLVFALQGRLGRPNIETLTAQEWGFNALHLPQGHLLLVHGDGTALLVAQGPMGHRWMPFALTVAHDGLARLTERTDQLVAEAMAWVAAGGHRTVGWHPDGFLPIHTDTDEPWAHLPVANIGGERVLRTPTPETLPFLGVARAFFERHPVASATLPFPVAWDSLLLQTGLLDARGGWTSKPLLALGILSRNGTFAARALRDSWRTLSDGFLTEATRRGTLPSAWLAGWVWDTTIAHRAYRLPHRLTLAASSGNNPSARGLEHGLIAAASTHERLRLLSAFQQTAPDTYQRWVSP